MGKALEIDIEEGFLAFEKGEFGNDLNPRYDRTSVARAYYAGAKLFREKALQLEKELEQGRREMLDIFHSIHENEYCVSEEAEILIRTALGLPLGDEDEVDA